MKGTVVIGLGNRLLTDDGAGPRAAAMIRGALAGAEGVDVMEAAMGGLPLMEAMLGYDRAIIIDAMATGRAPGTVARLPLGITSASLNTYSTHTAPLMECLDMARALGMKVPSDVVVFGVEAADARSFGEALSPEVEAAMDALVRHVLEELGLGVGA